MSVAVALHKKQKINTVFGLGVLHPRFSWSRYMLAAWKHFVQHCKSLTIEIQMRGHRDELTVASTCDPGTYGEPRIQSDSSIREGLHTDRSATRSSVREMRAARHNAGHNVLKSNDRTKGFDFGAKRGKHSHIGHNMP